MRRISSSPARAPQHHTQLDAPAWHLAISHFLRLRYERSTQRHTVAFAPGSLCFADRIVDGAGGSVLLTELHGSLGSVVLLRRDFVKELLLQCASALGWPVCRCPGGQATLGFRPCSEAYSRPRAPLLLARALPLPAGVKETYLVPLLGEAWWGVCSASRAHTPTCREAGSCYILHLPAPDRAVRRLFPFPHTALTLTDREPVLIERLPDKRRFSLYTGDAWNFVRFLRYQRKKQGLRTKIVLLGGLGDVLV